MKSHSLADAIKRIPASVIDDQYLPLFEYILFPEMLEHRKGHHMKQDSLHEIFYPKGGTMHHF